MRHSRVADCQDSLRRPPRRPLAFARPRAGRTNTRGAIQHRRRPRPDRSNERRRAFAAAAHAIIRWRLPLYAWPERSMRQPDARHSLSAQTVARTPRPAPLLRESHRTPGSPRTNRTAPLASSFAAAGQLLQDRIGLYPNCRRRICSGGSANAVCPGSLCRLRIRSALVDRFDQAAPSLGPADEDSERAPGAAGAAAMRVAVRGPDA